MPRWAASGTARGIWQSLLARLRRRFYLPASLALLGAVPAPAQSRLCWQPAAPVHTQGLACGHPVPAPTGQWARPAGMVLGTRGAQTRLGAGYASPRDCWVPKQLGGSLMGSCVPPQGSPALKAQTLSHWCLAAWMAWVPQGAILHLDHHRAPYSWRAGCQGMLQLLLPHRGECIPHAALG